MPFAISWEQVRTALAGNSLQFPKYTTQIMNLANQNAQATRPAVVGQMSDLIQQFEGRTYDEWATWYRSRYPVAIGEATTRVLSMLDNLRRAFEQIDESMVRSWVTDLVISKTFAGFRFQQVILAELGARRGVQVRLATPEDEARGIDGYLGNQPVSVKPSTYRNKASLSEVIDAPVVYYDKTKIGVSVDDTAL